MGEFEASIVPVGGCGDGMRLASFQVQGHGIENIRFESMYPERRIRMRLSRLLIAVAAAFSASAFAMLPPESKGPLQDETASAPGSLPSSSAEERDRREENAWLSTRPNSAWQSSAQNESDQSQSTEQGDDAQSPGSTAQSLPSDPPEESRSLQIGRSQEESS
jgi:hypothetical protein